MISSCKDCTERFIGCHGVCETYIQQKNEHLLKKEQVLQAKKITYYLKIISRNQYKDKKEREV